MRFLTWAGLRAGRRIGFAVALVVCGCRADLPHRWTDEGHGFTVQADFERHLVEPVLRSSVDVKLDSLCALFGIDEFGELTIYVHDLSGPEVGSARAGGYHDSAKGEVHVFAGLGLGGAISPLRPGSEHSLEHELVHACIHRAGLSPPRWMEEGLCDVLAASATDGSGDIVLLWADRREVQVRSLRSGGGLLTADELLAARDAYPPADELPALYAQAGSFVGARLHAGGEDLPARRRLDSLLASSTEELRAEYAQWEGSLGSTSPAAAYRRLLPSADLVLRTDFARRVDGIYQDEEWWSLLESLLLDPEPAIRSEALVPALHEPADTAATRARFTRWSSSSDVELRLAGLLGLAQLGEMEATLAFLDTLAARPPELMLAPWAIPVLWIVLGQRRRGPQFESLALPDPGRMGMEPEYLGDFTAGLAAELRGI